MYNRITRRLYVAPFTLHETEQMTTAMGLGWSRETVLLAHLTDGPFAIDAEAERQLLRKRDVFRDETGTRSAVHIALVSANGLAAWPHAGTVAATVTADDLFAF